MLRSLRFAREYAPASKHAPLGKLLFVTMHIAPRLFLSLKIKVFLGTPNAQGDESKSYEVYVESR